MKRLVGLLAIIVGFSVSTAPRASFGSMIHPLVTTLAPTVTTEGPVQVEVAPDMFEGESYHAWIHERARSALDRDDPLEPGERIVIGLSGMALSYSISIQAYRPGDERPQWTTEATCKCSLDDMLVKVEGLVGQAADELEAIAEAERKLAEEGERLAREQAEREATERAGRGRGAGSSSGRYRLAPLGFAGAVVTGVGAATTITGIALAAKGDGAPPDSAFLLPPDYKPSGLALLGVGLVVVTTGVSLLVVDVVRCRRDRVRCDARGKVFDGAAWNRRRGLTWSR